MVHVDRKIAFEAGPADIEAAGYSGAVRTFVPRAVKNPEVTSTGEIVSPTSTTLSITSTYLVSVA